MFKVRKDLVSYNLAVQKLFIGPSLGTKNVTQYSINQNTVPQVH